MTPSGSSQRPLRLQQKCLNTNDNQKPGETTLLSEQKLHQMWRVFVSRPKSRTRRVLLTYCSSQSWCRSRMMHLWRQNQKGQAWMVHFKHSQHLQIKLKQISCFGARFLFQDVTFSCFHTSAHRLSASAITSFFKHSAPHTFLQQTLSYDNVRKKKKETCTTHSSLSLPTKFFLSLLLYWNPTHTFKCHVSPQLVNHT